MSQTLTIYRGTDIRHRAVVTDAEQTPIDLLGYTVALFEASPELGATVTVTNAAAGEVEVSAEWRDEWKSGNRLSYRLRVSVNGRDTAWPPVIINIR